MTEIHAKPKEEDQAQTQVYIYLLTNIWARDRATDELLYYHSFIVICVWRCGHTCPPSFMRRTYILFFFFFFYLPLLKKLQKNREWKTGNIGFFFVVVVSFLLGTTCHFMYSLIFSLFHHCMLFQDAVVKKEKLAKPANDKKKSLKRL